MSIDPIAAIHEGGHAVVAACAGYDIREVVLHPIGSRPDEAGHCLLQSDWEAELRADPIGFLVYLFSGGSAEKRGCGSTSARGAQDVETAAFIAAEIIHDGADANSARVQGTLRAAAAIADSRMAIPGTWRAVQRVADALRRRRRLTGRDVQLLLREAQR